MQPITTTQQSALRALPTVARSFLQDVPTRQPEADSQMRRRWLMLAVAVLVAGAVMLLQTPAQARDRVAAGTVFGAGAGDFAGQRFGGSVYVVPQGPSIRFGAPAWGHQGYDGYVVVPRQAGQRRYYNHRGHSARSAYRQGYQDGRRDARREFRRGW